MRTIAWRALSSAVYVRVCLPSSCPKTRANGFMSPRALCWAGGVSILVTSQSWISHVPRCLLCVLYSKVSRAQATRGAAACCALPRTRLRIYLYAARVQANIPLSNLNIPKSAAKMYSSFSPHHQYAQVRDAVGRATTCLSVGDGRLDPICRRPVGHTSTPG